MKRLLTWLLKFWPDDPNLDAHPGWPFDPDSQVHCTQLLNDIRKEEEQS